MKVSTDVFSADKGHQSGALIEVFTKPGTNRFHGTLSEFYTGSALTARTEFQAVVPRYLRNDFGGSQPNLPPPLVRDWALGIQRGIGKSVVIEADYFGTSSTHLYFQTDANRFAGDLVENKGGLARLNPSFGAVLYGQSIGVANAEVAAFAISKRFSRGWSAHAIYNYGKSLDYTSGNDNGVGRMATVVSTAASFITSWPKES
jgi:hypothetical protein